MTRHSVFPEAELVDPGAPSFQTVVDRLRASDELTPSRKRDLLSGVQRVADILCHGRALREIPADAEWCRPRLARILPASIGISPKTWANLTSNLAAAFEAASIRKRRFEIQLDGEWAELWSKVRASGDKQIATGLSRFPRYCQQAGLQPADVTDETLQSYGDLLDQNELTRCPHRSMYSAARAWNIAVDAIDGWPQNKLEVPTRRRVYALPWSSFPPSLEREIDEWLAKSSENDIFSLEGPSRALAPSTAKLRKGSLQRFASALVHAGVPSQSIVGLCTLVQPDLVRRGLQWLLDNGHGRQGAGLGNIAISIVMAAKHRAHLSTEGLEALEKFARRLSRPDRGMTEKNRCRLEVFKDPGLLERLLRLPDTLIREAKTKNHPERRATGVETALAIAILTYCPIRFGNLCALEIDRHLVRVGRGRNARLLLKLPRKEVKNHVDLQFELPPHVVTLMETFTSTYRPVLARVPSRYLFTMRSADAPIGFTSIRNRIQNAVRHHVGADLTPHNFRHLAGFILLNQYPGQYETVRRLLGHKHGSTALDHYVGLEDEAAHRTFSDLLDGLRSGQDG